MNGWYIFSGSRQAARVSPVLPLAPPWRRFDGEVRVASDLKRRPLPDLSAQDKRRGQSYQSEDLEVEMVNAALVLRRPLLVTGKPGTGKSSLAYAVAYELGLGPILHWPISSRSTLKDGLYSYDVLGRLQAQQLNPSARTEVSSYLRLGPLGTALVAADRPRVLLIDEIDKSDIDLPNDLLHVFEEGQFEIPELVRLPNVDEPVEIQTADDDYWVPIVRGKVRCHEFPFVVLTSNGEREFPPPFLRRCIRLTLPEPSPEKLAAIVETHLGQPDSPDARDEWQDLVNSFQKRRDSQDLATDQLLNALYLRHVGAPLGSRSHPEAKRLEEAILKPLAGAQAT
jgi:MoxR-like ATPase